MGAPLPIRTPPTLAVWVFLRWKMAMEVLVYHWECGLGAGQKGGSEGWFKEAVQEAAVQEPGNKAGEEVLAPSSFYGSLPELNTLVTSLKITTDANSTKKTNAVW